MRLSTLLLRLAGLLAAHDIDRVIEPVLALRFTLLAVVRRARELALGAPALAAGWWLQRSASDRPPPAAPGSSEHTVRRTPI